MKKHIPLIIAIALPVVFIIILSVVVFLPKQLIQPAHNFIYTMRADQYNGKDYTQRYVVKNDVLVLEDIVGAKSSPEYYTIEGAPQLYVYNFADDTTKKIDFADAQKYTLDPNSVSSDGYSVSYQYGNYGIIDIFGSSSRDRAGYFVSSNKAQRKLTGLNQIPNGGYYGSFNFIGWITK